VRPRFDAPSIFGTLLDRQCGTFRLGPFGINVPTARIYEPGTNIVSTRPRHRRREPSMPARPTSCLVPVTPTRALAALDAVVD
jgi:hypothetical protein